MTTSRQPFSGLALAEVRYIPIRERSPQEVRERLLSSPLPPDLSAALAEEMAPEGQ